MKAHVTKSLITFFKVRMDFGSGSPKARIGHASEDKSQAVGSKSGCPKYRILGPD